MPDPLPQADADLFAELGRRFPRGVLFVGIDLEGKAFISAPDPVLAGGLIALAQAQVLGTVLSAASTTFPMGLGRSLR